MFRVSGLDGQFERVEHAAGVTVGHIHQVRQRIVVDLDVELAVAALGIGQRLASDRERDRLASSGLSWKMRLRLTSALLTSK